MEKHDRHMTIAFKICKYRNMKKKGPLDVLFANRNQVSSPIDTAVRRMTSASLRPLAVDCLICTTPLPTLAPGAPAPVVDDHAIVSGDVGNSHHASTTNGSTARANDVDVVFVDDEDESDLCSASPVNVDKQENCTDFAIATRSGLTSATAPSHLKPAASTTRKPHKFNVAWRVGREWLTSVTKHHSTVVVGMFCSFCQRAHTSNLPTTRRHKKSTITSVPPDITQSIPWVTIPCLTLELRAVKLHEQSQTHQTAVRILANSQDVGCMLLTSKNREMEGLVGCFECIYFNAKHQVLVFICLMLFQSINIASQ